jgi:hypothetical protein
MIIQHSVKGDKKKAFVLFIESKYAYVVQSGKKLQVRNLEQGRRLAKFIVFRRQPSYVNEQYTCLPRPCTFDSIDLWKLAVVQHYKDSLLCYQSLIQILF